MKKRALSLLMAVLMMLCMLTNAFPSVKTVAFEVNSAIKFLSNSILPPTDAFPDVVAVYIKMLSQC